VHYNEGEKGRIERVDSLSPAERSEIMARVRSRNSRPELFVRKLAFALGYRYRLHARDLPGRPDIVFRKRRKVIFIHGCFWHRHGACALARLPKSRLEFWLPKLEGNKRRDEKNKRALWRQGWKVLTIWECQLKSSARLSTRLRRFLDA
jgi:DNA mismatch endonuclease (patch repair protein)